MKEHAHDELDAVKNDMVAFVDVQYVYLLVQPRIEYILSSLHYFVLH